MRTIQRVAVLGAGTMGARIAAHFANAGIPALLLDIVVPGQPDRNLAAKKGLESALKQKPGGFFVDSAASLVTCGNFEDDLPRISSCGWIIEAVTENLEIKRALWSKVDALRDPESILSTNTSGIPLSRITEGFSESFRRQFLGTHFFNPPRYLHLCEVIPMPETAPEITAFVTDFCDRRLGKGVVICKDTPNFIGNRIGCFWGATIYKYAVEGGYTVEEVDALTGSLIGLPNSASFRLVDIVGLDIWAYVGRNLYDLVPEDPWRDRFLPPPFVDEMMRRKWLGEKTGGGFYRRVGKEKTIEALDLNTFEYRPAAKVSFPSVEQARNIASLPERLRALIAARDRAGDFLWKVFRDVLLYSAERIPEISDRIVEVDQAMRWGYAHTFGPFELWDALGFEETALRMESNGFALPENVRRIRETGASAFYKTHGTPHYFDFTQNSYQPLKPRPGITVLATRKDSGKVVKTNPGASLIDLGDGVLCLEFHSKLNTLGEDSFAMIHAAAGETEKNWEALVIGNQGGDFCTGANLVLVLLAAQDGKWDELSAAVARFQQGLMRLKYLSRPVVAAPFARTLGGGTEIVLHAAAVQASAELYIGLVEVGAGVVPAGGGCKEAILRWKDPRRAFETIGFAKVSGSAADARQLGYLNSGDRVSMNAERLIEDAKQLALSLAPDWSPGRPRTDIPVSGEAGYALMKMGAWMAQQGGFITDYDMVVAEKLAFVLSGGRLTGEQTVSEQYLLDLEREAFVSLCGDPRTQARMQHILKTGKPLRN